MTSSETSSLPDFIAPLGKLYGKVVRARGDTPSGVGWSTQQVQDLRFHILLSILDNIPADDPITVCDFGCGWGALWDKLVERSAPTIGSYIGYDISDEMITRANKRKTDPRAQFFVYDGSLQHVDYAFVSGTFNFHDRIPRETWEPYVCTTLDKIAAQCHHGLAFNFLHKRFQKKRPMFYTEPEPWIKKARVWLDARGGGEVFVRDNYLPDDFTVFVRFSKPGLPNRLEP